MVKETPIVCPHCKKATGWTQEGLRYYYLDSDLRCPHCNAIVIKCIKPIYSGPPISWTGNSNAIERFEVTT